MRKVVHFEIPADDLDRAREFYRSALGWKLATMPMPDGDYTTATTVDVDSETMVPVEPGAINGGIVQRDDRTPTPVVTVEVDSIEDALSEIEAAGGATLAGRTDIPGGAFAYFTDTEGNVGGLWQNT